MWLVGAISQDELEAVRKHKPEWDIREIQKDGLNLMLDPDYLGVEDDPEEGDDVYIAVFIDQDLDKQLEKWNEDINLIKLYYIWVKNHEKTYD